MLKVSTENENMQLRKLLQDSTEKSKDLRNQLDGLGLAVEFAQNALNRSESALEDKEKDLHDAHSALLLKEVIGSTLKKQAGTAPYRYNGALCCTATIPYYAVLSCAAINFAVLLY
jgi:hypothetical protein